MPYEVNTFLEWQTAVVHESTCTHITTTVRKSYDSVGEALDAGADRGGILIARPGKCCLEAVDVVAVNLNRER